MVGRWFIAAIDAMVDHRPGAGVARRRVAGDQRRRSRSERSSRSSAISARLYGPASALAGVQVQIVSALAVFERIFDYLDMQPEGRPRSPNAIVLENVRGDVASTTCSSPTATSARRSTASAFHIEPGQMAAFVGPSGAGKTTITQLVPRFYDPQRGSVRSTAYDVRDVDARVAAREHRHRHAGDVSLPRYDRGESALRARRTQPTTR